MNESVNPWKKLNEKQVYDNPWIRVEEHRVINPKGNPGIYGKVCFKNKAIGILPIDENLNTWLVGQYRYTLDEYSWEIPTGGCPMNEDPLTAAKRELKEETGLVAEKWTDLLRIHTSNSVTDEEGFIFVAQNLSQEQPEFEDTELIAIRKLPFEEALDLVMNGYITDSLSIAGILKYSKILSL